MRISLRLDDHLLAAAKRHAAAHGLTLSRVIEEALRTMLNAHADAATAPFAMPTFGEGGVLQGSTWTTAPGSSTTWSNGDPAERERARVRPPQRLRGSERNRHWLNQQVNADTAFGLADPVLAGFLRVVTHPGIFARPTPLHDALLVTSALRARPNCVELRPGRRHWRLFDELCRAVQARGNLVADAYLAALAIEAGAEWITTDRDFSRFPGLRWRHPLHA